MAKKKEVLKPLSGFEEDLLWMSSRYAIGRKTIAAHGLACDILKNMYRRLELTPDRMNFNSRDINREIESSLRYGPFNIYFENNYSQERNIFYLEELYKAISDENGDLKYNIKDIESVHIDCRTNIVKITIRSTPSETTFASDFTDLEIWQLVAKMFDKNCHKTCTVKFGEEDPKEVEYIDFYSFDTQNNKILKRKMPIDRVIENPYINTYINEQYIIKE
jgi:hypothetical protein